MYSFSTHNKNQYLPLIIAMMVYYNLTDAENTSWISTEVRITSKLSWCANPLGSKASSFSDLVSLHSPSCSLCSRLLFSPGPLLTSHTLPSENLYPCCFFCLEWCPPDLFSASKFLFISEEGTSFKKPSTTI